MSRSGPATPPTTCWWCERGEVVLVRPAMHDTPEEIVASEGPGRFLGELNLLPARR